MNYQDRQTAWEILETLCDSTFADEFQYYRQDVQTELKLSDSVVERLYDLKKIVELLRPVDEKKRYFKGRLVEGSRPTSRTVSQFDASKHETSPYRDMLIRLLVLRGANDKVCSLDVVENDSDIIIYNVSSLLEKDLEDLGAKKKPTGTWWLNRQLLLSAWLAVNNDSNKGEPSGDAEQDSTPLVVEQKVVQPEEKHVKTPEPEPDFPQEEDEDADSEEQERPPKKEKPTKKHVSVEESESELEDPSVKKCQDPAAKLLRKLLRKDKVDYKKWTIGATGDDIVLDGKVDNNTSLLLNQLGGRKSRGKWFFNKKAFVNRHSKK